MTQSASIEQIPTIEPREIGCEKPATLAPARLSTISFSAAGAHLRVCWRFLIHRAASRKRKLAVQETVALGDRRFVSVIQFERHRFLIASSPSSVSLLSRLSDEPAEDEEPGDQSLRKSKENN